MNTVQKVIAASGVVLEFPSGNEVDVPASVPNAEREHLLCRSAEYRTPRYSPESHRRGELFVVVVMPHDKPVLPGVLYTGVAVLTKVKVGDRFEHVLEFRVQCIRNPERTLSVRTAPKKRPRTRKWVAGLHRQITHGADIKIMRR